MRVFHELGFEVTDGPPGRDDFLLRWKGQLGIVEVKGKSGSASEGDAAQLEKYKLERHVEGEPEAKAFLVVNAFRNAPPSERSERVFPGQMLKFATKREQCLVSTAQLFSIMLEIRSEPKRKAEIAESLWNNVGVFEGFNLPPTA